MPLVSDKKWTDGWSQGAVTLRMFYEDKDGRMTDREAAPKVVTASVKGPLAVHPSVNAGEDGLWSVSVSAVGWRVAVVRGEAAARKLADLLAAHWPEVCKATTTKGAEAVGTVGLRNWLRACSAARACLGVEPYLGGGDRD